MDNSGNLPDTNLAPEFLIPCGILLVISVCLCVARIISRLRPSPHLHWDDYLISIATVLSFLGYIATCVCATHGWGHLTPYVSQKNRTVVFKALFATQLGWICATALVRISVAVSLFRLSRCAGEAEKIWKWCLRSIIVIQLLASTGWFILLVFNCHPVRGLWEPVPKFTCWDNKYTTNFGWVANPIIIVMDFILATMPIQLIRMLQRTLREKILISCLMATGLVATACASYKMTLSQQANSGDLLATTVKISLWCKLEEQIGIIAACLPCLKAQMEKLLCRIGILDSRIPTMVVSLRPFRIVFGPSEIPRMISTEDENSNVTRNGSDAGSMTYTTNQNWSGAKDTNNNSTSTSSESREAGPKAWDA